MPVAKRQFTFDGKPILLFGEKPSGCGSERNVQDFYEIRQKCLDSGKLFEDPEFPTNNKSLFKSVSSKIETEWRRPKEICKDPKFFVDGVSRFDVDQGDLGDCWLLAATASLTQNQKLFTQVVCNDNSFVEKYAGIFHFRFWQYGKWIDVVIDDRLPVYKDQLMFMRSKTENEFWSALLEKAYAKLFGSYEALKGGTTCEGLEDFTGGITEFLKSNDTDDLLNILMKAFQRKSMMGCSIEPDKDIVEAKTPEGLIRGHAYSITKISMVNIVTPNRSGEIPLVRLRNPWGNEVEWKGPWSDNSREWQFIPEEFKKKIDLSFDNDGEFWMSFQDFQKNFNCIELCNLSPDSLIEEKDKWNLTVFEGQWVAGVSSGGCRNYLETFYQNPQYVITLDKPDEDDKDGKCSVVIALMQKNRRKRHLENLTIGFAVYHLMDQDLAIKPQPFDFFKFNSMIGKSSSYINLREVSGRFRFFPGSYLIVPSTYKPTGEGEFLIRVFSESNHTFTENDRIVAIGEVESKVKIYTSAVEESEIDETFVEKLFEKFSESKNEIGWVELKRILDHTMSEETLKQTKIASLNNNQIKNGKEINTQTREERKSFFSSMLGSLCRSKSELDEDNPDDNTQHQLLKPSQSREQIGNESATKNQYVDSYQGFSKDICRSMVAMLDIDHSGMLGLEEFKILFYDITKWKKVFKMYDHDSNNKLNTSELREAFESVGYHLNNHILNSLVYRYGSSDKTIAFDDFILCAVKVKTMIDHFKEKDYDNANKATFSMDEWVTKALYS